VPRPTLRCFAIAIFIIAFMFAMAGLIGARDGDRTREIGLGKPAFYR
jgi:hypothetical protein